MKKKVLSFFLALVMVLCPVPMAAFAEGTSTEPTESSGESSPPEESVEEKTGTAVVQALIDALPDAESINESNMEDVMNELEAIDDAKFLLSEEETAALDFTRYDAAVAVLTGNGAGLTSTPMLINTEVTSVSTEQQLKDAVDKGGSIQLTADITLTKKIYITKTVALDLRGHTITNDYVIYVSSPDGSLTISDSSTAGNGEISDYIYVDGILQITGGTVSTINVQNGGVTLSAGTISTLYMSENSTFTMTGGIVSSEIYMSGNSTFTMTGGIVSVGVQMSKNSTFTMTGGIVSRNLYMSKNNTFNAGGGTVQGDVVNYGIIQGYSNGTTTFEDEVENYRTISDGIFYKEVTNKGTISGGIFYKGIGNDGTIASSAYVTVNFIDSSGTIGTQQVLRGQTATQRTKAGYNAAYYTDSSYSETFDMNSAITTSASTFNIYVTWTEKSNYTVKYSSNGGSTISDKTGVKWTDKVLNGVTNPTKNGYEFAGWTYSADGATTVVTDTTTYADLAKKDTVTSITLTATWSEKNSFTVTFNTDGGTAINDKTGVKWTDTVLENITAPTKNGYEFTGWTYSADGATAVDVDETTTYAGLAEEDAVMSVTLTAQWKDIANPVISGIKDGKSYGKAQTVTVIDENLNTVTLNGETVTLDENGQFVLSPADGEQKIIATDKEGNKAEVTVTINDGHTFSEWKVTKSATFFKDGVETRTCVNEGCTETETRTVLSKFSEFKSGLFGVDFLKAILTVFADLLTSVC